MEIRPVRTERDYRRSLKEIERLMEAKAGTPEGDRLDVLVTLVEAYEARRFPLGFPDPIEAIRFAMEQKGLTAKDLEPLIGRLNRVYEVLNGKRALTLPMIRHLHRDLGIPAECLIRPPKSARAA
jgi:HTH-type transcriptional regulator/antitoxin HigA